MPEAYIYDHVRTPRGRGKSDGALHEVTALALATVPLQALKERNNLGEDVDAYAEQSQQRAAKAWDEVRLNKSVVPVKYINGLTILAKDEHMRPTTTMQSLGQLQPAFVFFF